MLPAADLKRLVGLAEQADAVLLVDETYRDLTHGDPSPLAASLSPRELDILRLGGQALGHQGQLDQRPHRPVRAQHRVGQLEQRIRPRAQTVVEAAAKARQHAQ